MAARSAALGWKPVANRAPGQYPTNSGAALRHRPVDRLCTRAECRGESAANKKNGGNSSLACNHSSSPILGQLPARATFSPDSNLDIS
jgi:hypothetical protein